MYLQAVGTNDVFVSRHAVLSTLKGSKTATQVDGKYVPPHAEPIALKGGAHIDLVHLVSPDVKGLRGDERLHYEFFLRADTMPLDAGEDKVREEDIRPSRFRRSPRRFTSPERDAGWPSGSRTKLPRRDDHWEPSRRRESSRTRELSPAREPSRAREPLRTREPSRAPPREPRHMRNGRNWEPNASPTKPYARPRFNSRLARIEEADFPRRSL